MAEIANDLDVLGYLRGSEVVGEEGVVELASCRLLSS